jgi:hypothetical protein
MNRKLMRTFQFAALALTAFGATMTVKAPEANAVVYCAAGVYRAGCVTRPVTAASVNGVARRTARRTVSTLNDGSRQPSRTLPASDNQVPDCRPVSALSPAQPRGWCHPTDNSGGFGH